MPFYYSLGLSRTAFTLAEVLITLGIIGIVAAMTIPTLVANYRGNVLQTQTKKAYSILSQALQQMQYDTGQIPNHENYGSEQGANETGGGKFMDTFRPYFLSFGNCKTRECITQSYNDEDGTLVSGLTNKYRNYNNTSDVSTGRFDDGQMIMSDGMFLMVENYTAEILLTIDVNGLNNKPNRWGHDLFTFQIDEKSGKLLPMGAPNTKYSESSYCNTDSNSSFNGIGCTYKAITDKEYFKNLPK